MDKQLEKLISLHDLDVMIADLNRKEIRDKEADMGLKTEGAWRSSQNSVKPTARA